MLLEWGFSQLISDNFAILTLDNMIQISPWNKMDFLSSEKMAYVLQGSGQYFKNEMS